MGLKETQAQWEKMAQEDALYGVLSHPDKRGGKWDLEEFLATGQDEIDERMAWLRQQGFEGIQTGRSLGPALDFGCGVGRLTQALAGYYRPVTGVDVSPSMIAKAQAINRKGDLCVYALNEKSDLGDFAPDTFAMVYSNIVLQHLPVDLALGYVKEFARILEPEEGMALFFYPEKGEDNRLRKGLKALAPQSWLRAYRRWRYGESGLNHVEIEMNGAPAEAVRSAFAAGGGRILKAEKGWYLGEKL